jgi:hypothetical protein
MIHSVISTEKIFNSGREAAASGYNQARAGGNRVYSASHNGITFRIYLDETLTTVTNSHPTMKQIMTMHNLSKKQTDIIHNCLLDLLESNSLNNPSFLPKALNSLIKLQGFGIEMSGIYISLDEDQQNVPDYLDEGIAFEFMDDQVTLSFKEAIRIIIDWCHSHNQTKQFNLDETLDNLKKRFL